MSWLELKLRYAVDPVPMLDARGRVADNYWYGTGLIGASCFAWYLGLCHLFTGVNITNQVIDQI